MRSEERPIGSRPFTRACFLFLFFLALLPHTSLAQNFSPGESIKSFDIELVFENNLFISVEETITYDFGTNQKHGIFRDIPYKYVTDRGIQESTTLSVKRVTDEEGNPYPYEESNENGRRHIKIGDPGKTISGEHTYKIVYSVSRAIGYFDDFDELYWNVTGNDWPVPIERSSVTIGLPQVISVHNLRFSCYFGPTGSTASCGDKESLINFYGANAAVEKVALTFDQTLLPGEGMTIAIGFPKGILKEPTWAQIALTFLLDNPFALLPFLVFGLMFAHWYHFGRDPRGRGAIIPEYDAPQGLSVLEMAGLMRGKVSGDDISAALIALAIDGYIKIQKKEERKLIFKSDDYILYRLEKEPASGSFEKALLDALFTKTHGMEDRELDMKLFGDAAEIKVLPSVIVSDLKNKFYSHISALEKKAMTSLVKKGYYVVSPQSTIGKYFLWGGLLFFALLFFGIVKGGFNILAVVVSFGIYAVFAFLMPRITKKGALMREYLLGLKEYLQIAEKNRLEFHNAPEKTPELFERLLPAALVLGVSDIWAKEFSDISAIPSHWYAGTSGAHFSSSDFSADIRGFSSFTSSSLASAPSGSGSGGGGSSGGGGGGGGGGSW